jgi:hypothetical protein
MPGVVAINVGKGPRPEIKGTWPARGMTPAGTVPVRVLVGAPLVLAALAALVTKDIVTGTCVYPMAPASLFALLNTLD